MYVNGKMVPAEAVRGMRGGGVKGVWWRGMIYLTYWKNFCKCHNAPLPSTNNNKKNYCNYYLLDYLVTLTILRIKYSV
jgi:hypothetical protein